MDLICRKDPWGLLDMIVSPRSFSNKWWQPKLAKSNVVYGGNIMENRQPDQRDEIIPSANSKARHRQDVDVRKQIELTLKGITGVTPTKVIGWWKEYARRHGQSH